MNPLGPTKTRPYLADALAEFYALHAYDQNQGMAMKAANDFLDTALPGKFLLTLVAKPVSRDTGTKWADGLDLVAEALRELAKRENPGKGRWNSIGNVSKAHWRIEARKIIEIASRPSTPLTGTPEERADDVLIPALEYVLRYDRSPTPEYGEIVNNQRPPKGGRWLTPREKARIALDSYAKMERPTAPGKEAGKP